MFKTPLGVGIAISDKDAFQGRFTTAFAGIRDRLKLGEQLPVCPSNRPLGLGYDRAAELGEQLVKSVQDLIESKCSRAIGASTGGLPRRRKQIGYRLARI